MMSVILLITLWAVAAGFVTAGLFASFYQLVTSSPVSFRLLMTGEMMTAILCIPLLLFSGPMVITRNAWGGRVSQQRAWGWIMASLAIVTCWSFITGVVVLEFVLKLMH